MHFCIIFQCMLYPYALKPLIQPQLCIFKNCPYKRRHSLLSLLELGQEQSLIFVGFEKGIPEFRVFI
jgi:hypothetical protein